MIHKLGPECLLWVSAHSITPAPFASSIFTEDVLAPERVLRYRHQHSCFIFGRSRLQILARTLATLRFFCGFPQFHQAHAWMSLEIKSKLIFSTSFPINHSSIILPFNTILSELLKDSLNITKINERFSKNIYHNKGNTRYT